MNAIRYTFGKHERLKRRQHIETLFRDGKAFSVFPLRVVFLAVPRPEGNESPVRIGFSVPKKKWKHAVQRNRIKRLMREAWRLQKGGLYATIPSDIQWHLFLLFTDKEMPDYAVVMQKMAAVIEKLQTNNAPAGS